VDSPSARSVADGSSVGNGVDGSSQRGGADGSGAGCVKDNPGVGNTASRRLSVVSFPVVPVEVRASNTS